VDGLRGPETRRVWGVDGAAAVAVPGIGDVERYIIKFEFGGEVYEIYRHPHLFLTEEIIAWYNQYKWVDKAGAAVDYRDTNPKYHIAAGIYETFLARFSRKP